MDLKHLAYAAEDHFLQSSELDDFQNCMTDLQQRLQLYEALRENETELWETVISKIEENNVNASSQQLEKALQHWVLVLRYGAMAMLLSKPEFLQWRLLEWLTGIVEAHGLTNLEAQIYEQVSHYLQSQLTASSWGLLEPYLAIAQKTLLSGNKMMPLPVSSY